LTGERKLPHSSDMNETCPAMLSFELLSALHAVEDRLEAALEPRGLSLAKFGALSQLVAAGEPLPLSTLATRCACVRSNITQLMDRLEAEKLVVRAGDPRDRRSVRAELTAEGGSARNRSRRTRDPGTTSRRSARLAPAHPEGSPGPAVTFFHES
jgi:DNA-binding MarR family transcriptional regulator